MNARIKFSEPLKHPTAFLPITMSLVALAFVLAHLAMSDIRHEADEGAAAHVWQLLMAGQIPIVGLFAVTRFPQAPRVALLILALQVVAALAAMAPVYFLHL